jgi:hypothetical protein
MKLCKTVSICFDPGLTMSQQIIHPGGQDGVDVVVCICICVGGWLTTVICTA